MHRAVLAILACGCGRLSFEPSGDAALDGSGDAGPDAAAKAPCEPVPGQLMCESFEGAPVLPTTAGDVGIDDTRVFRGARAQIARTTGNQESAWMLGGALPNVTSGDLYARWWVYLPTFAAPAQLATVHLVDAINPYRGVVLGVQDDAIDVSCSEVMMTDVSTVPLPRDRWTCLQLHVSIANTGGFVETFVDGVPAARIDGIDTLPANGYRNVHVGLYATGFATVAQELSSDELAVGTLPIPCD